MKKDTSFSALLEELSAGINMSAVRPSINKYVPHAKQLMFHKSEKQGRLYIGGNRSGKTVGGIVEDIWWLLGKHPYVETPPPPIFGRIVTVDFENGWELIIKPTLLNWLPRSELINGSWEDSWSEKYKVLTLRNGSKLDIMSYNQQTDKQAGTSRDFVHFDEEPPSVLFDENKMRLLDKAGRWWVTMTPVEGMSWTYDTIFEPGKNGDPYIDVIEVNTDENPHLSESAIDEYLSGMDEDSKRARKKGEYVQIGGLVLKDFDKDFHLIPERIPPKEWPWYVSYDHGLNHPAAWYWHAISPDGTVVTFYEHHKSNMTISEHARKVHEINRQLGKKPDGYVGDPAIRQRLSNTGKSVYKEYLDVGIPIRTSNNDRVVGVDQLIYRLRSGKWFITENCKMLVWEMKRWKWKTRPNKKLQEKHGPYDEPMKKDDDGVDSCRYFFINHRIDALTESIDADKKKRLRAIIDSALTPSRPYNVFAGRIDEQILNSPTPPRDLDETAFLGEDYGTTDRDWSFVTDDHMGGIY